MAAISAEETSAEPMSPGVMVAQWISWASATVEAWPDQVADAPFDLEAARDSVALAEQVAAIVRR